MNLDRSLVCVDRKVIYAEFDGSGAHDNMKRSNALILKVIILVSLFSVLIANFLPLHKQVQHKVDNIPSLNSSEFRRALGHLLGPQFVGGNKVRSYQNGDEIFPAMLDAIRSAKKTITFEAYIYWSDHIGQQFIEALSERARNGVQVHVLVDWMGSFKLETKYAEKLIRSGVELEYFRPLNLINLPRMNHRTHRRILVIDGKLGFTGGVGISDEWTGNADKPELWRDSQYQVEGPVVSALQSAFMDNWLKLRPEVHHDENYFPVLENVGPAHAQVFKSSPNEGGESVRLMYQLAIASARKNIRVSSAYFLPDKTAIRELLEARKRGVEIEVITPGPHTDAPIVKFASKAQWGPLLKAGVKIYEFQPARYHRKSMIVDSEFVSVGSTNFDYRSFRLNDEENLNILDADFAKTEIEQFEKDKSQSIEETYVNWKSRAFVDKLKENLAGFFKEQL